MPTRSLPTSWPPYPGRACVTLHRLFAERLGVSVMTFYRDLRLSKADELLQQSALSVLDIALLTGFTSVAHFARSFREKYGVSPRERRRVWQAGPTSPGPDGRADESDAG